MPVIKEFESRVEDIACLEGLIAEYGAIPAIKKTLELELWKIKSGDKAEKNASYLLGSFYKDRKNSFLINGLRLELDGYVAQIDHMTLNGYGVVYLFETKTFSTGIKIDDDGTFWRWDSYNKSYVEIPSPIEQSKRHERVVRQALDKIGYSVQIVHHFVVVDYKAKLIKPKKGFENVCRPDRVEKAIDIAIDKIGVFTTLRLMGKMLSGKKHSVFHTKQFAKKLVALHSPINMNFRAKFGLEQAESPQVTTQLKTPEPPQKNPPSQNQIAEPAPTYQVPEPPAKLTLAKLAQSMNLKTAVLEGLLIDQGYLERREKGVYLAQKGKASGFEVRKGKFGFYFLIPSGFCLEVGVG